MARRKPTSFRSPFSSGRNPSATFAWDSRRPCCAIKSRRACISAGYWALGSVLLSTLLALLVSTHRARADRANFRATRPHFRGPVRRRAGGRARRRTGRGQHENRGNRKAVARRARNFQHVARKSRPGDERARGWLAALQRRRAAPCWSARPSKNFWAGVPTSCEAGAWRDFSGAASAARRAEDRRRSDRAGGREGSDARWKGRGRSESA